MKQLAPEDKTTLTEVRNWLLVVRQSPAKYGSVLRRARQNAPQWVPMLTRLATRERGQAALVAVKVLTEMVAKAKSIEPIIEIFDSMPRRSSALAEVATAVTEKLLAALPKESTGAGTEAALLWNNLSGYCHDANQTDAALRCAEQAVEASRSFSPQDSAKARLHVICLLTLAQRQAEMDKPDPALASVEGAWTLATALGKSGEIQDRILEAQVEMSRANRLAAVGRMDEATAAASRARELLGDLPDSPETLDALATADLTLASVFTQLGRHEDSAPHADSAERRLRVRAGENPDEHLEIATDATATFAQNLSFTGRHELAYDLLRGTVERMSEAARRQPERFGEALTALFISLADCAGHLERLAERLSYAKQALMEARRLGRRLKRRDWYLEGLAHMGVFDALRPRENFKEAEKAIRAAQRAFKQLPADHPEARSELALSYCGLAEILRASGRSGNKCRAVKAARQAVEILNAASAEKHEALKQLESHCHATLALCLASVEAR